jgi:photosystem II stability/assembly factor-like uncharacterized protein
MSTESPLTVLVGTRKGLFLARSDDRRDWSVSDPHFLGHVIQHAVVDPRDGRRLLLATNTGHLGPTVFRSDDMGETWAEASKPPAFRTGERLERSLDKLFWLSPGHPDQPEVWYAGGVPQGLFRTADGGDTWEPVDGWNDHENWEKWAEYPYEGTPDGAMLHSVNVDPRDPDHLYIGLSGGGVFESTDGGGDWWPLNSGVGAVFLPEPDAEYGHDPHCVRIHPARPDRVYQQNHCGIYVIERPADKWERVGRNMPDDVGDIGFPVELHPRDPDTAWVFPMDGSDVWPRTSPDGRPSVFVTHDAGTSWTRQDEGLPERAWFTVKRQAMTTDAGDPVGVYFGTTSGELWASADEGASWSCVTSHLPEIYSVEVAGGAGAGAS